MMLIENGADINQTDHLGRTALNCVNITFDKEVTRYLVSRKDAKFSHKFLFRYFNPAVNNRSQFAENCFTYKESLQMIMNPTRMSSDEAKSFKILMSPVGRYKCFKHDILSPHEHEDFNGFNKQQLLEIGIPWIFSKQKSNCCDYDIKFN